MLAEAAGRVEWIVGHANASVLTECAAHVVYASEILTLGAGVLVGTVAQGAVSDVDASATVQTLGAAVAGAVGANGGRLVAQRRVAAAAQLRLATLAGVSQGAEASGGRRIHQPRPATTTTTITSTDASAAVLTQINAQVDIAFGSFVSGVALTLRRSVVIYAAASLINTK